MQGNLKIRPYAEGDEQHVVTLGKLYSPQLSTNTEHVRLSVAAWAESKYRRKVFFAFDGDHLLGSLAYMQHAHQYQPDLYCLHFRPNAGVAFADYGPPLYSAVLEALRPLNPKTLNAWARSYETELLAFLADQGFHEFTRCVHMVFDVRAPAPDVALPAGIRIQSLADLKGDPEHLQKLYRLEMATSADIPHGQAFESPDFTWWASRLDGPAGFKTDTIFVATDGSRYVGFHYLLVNADGSAAVVAGTGVDRDYRRRGVAAQWHSVKRAGSYH